ncbi:MAG: hypothetical protein M5U09_02470 [Gammaproteobacteria bacterium]|nr:hypothetical protein [Gammaproteobacteria bacterium]
MFIVGALITYFVSGNRNYFQDREQSLMQENARYALKQLSDDIAMLGFFGHSINPPVSIAATITPDNDCLRTGASWPLGGTRLALLDHVAAEEQFSCIASGSLKAGTQVLAVNRAEGRASTDVSSSDDAGNVFIRTSPTEAGTLLVAPDASAILGGEYWRYISHIYYIVDEPTEDGLSTIPVLHRKTLRLDPDDGLGMHDTPGESLVVSSTSTSSSASTSIRIRHLRAEKRARKVAKAPKKVKNPPTKSVSYRAAYQTAWPTSTQRMSATQHVSVRPSPRGSMFSHEVAQR